MIETLVPLNKNLQAWMMQHGISTIVLHCMQHLLHFPLVYVDTTHNLPTFPKCAFSVLADAVIFHAHGVDEYLRKTDILEVNLFAFAYRVLHDDFSPI